MAKIVAKTKKTAKKAAKEASKAQAAIEKEVAQLEKEEERLCSLLPPSSMSGTVAPRLAYARPASLGQWSPRRARRTRR